MRSIFVWRALVGLGLAAVMLSLGVSAGGAQFGAGATKICHSPTLVGQLDKCSYTVQNLDSFGNTETVDFVQDQAFTFSHGNPTSGNVMSSVGIIVHASPFGGLSPTCTGGAGFG